MRHATHIPEQELVAYVFGDTESQAPIDAHLADCAACRAAVAELRAVLLAVNDETLPVPEPQRYADQVWAAVKPRLEAKAERDWRSWLVPGRLALAGGLVGLVVIAFVAGRVTGPADSAPRLADELDASGARGVQAAVLDHLERSQTVLVEVANTESGDGAVDLSPEQQRARDLLELNRLYRQSAARAGDPAVAAVLDELERVLIEIANSPSELSRGRLAELQQLIAEQGILFKVRVMGSKVRNTLRLEAVPRSGPTPSRAKKVTT